MTFWTDRPKIALLAWIVLCFLPATTGLLFPPGAWYQELVKPSWTPPNWLFGPAWTTLYLTMGIAAWRVWRRESTGGAIRLFLVQLALNAAWTPLFFGAHQLGLALVEIVLLTATVVATTVAFWRIDRPAGLLLVPYIGWLSFASALNGAIWWFQRSGA